jgi:hypothetical protein
MSKRVWKKGHVWTRKHLEKDVRLIEVRNFAKRKKAGLEDDVIEDWNPTTETSLKHYLTGYYDACDDLERWCMEQIDD